MIWMACTLAARAEEPLDARMETHWRLAAALQTEIVRGDLPVVRELAGRLASLPLEGASPELRPSLDALRANARRLAASATVDEAATRLAALGATCAACHAGTGGGPTVRPRAFPPEDCAQASGMVCHQWAADWLWLGLVAPSDAAWQRGAQALLRVAPDRALQALAAHAAAIEDPAARAVLYANVVRACADCHTAPEPKP